MWASRMHNRSGAIACCAPFFKYAAVVWAHDGVCDFDTNYEPSVTVSVGWGLCAHIRSHNRSVMYIVYIVYNIIWLKLYYIVVASRRTVCFQCEARAFACWTVWVRMDSHRGALDWGATRKLENIIHIYRMSILGSEHRISLMLLPCSVCPCLHATDMLSMSAVIGVVVTAPKRTCRTSWLSATWLAYRRRSAQLRPIHLCVCVYVCGLAGSSN